MLRLLSCLTKLGADVEAAVVCQLFPKSEHRRGLQLLQLNPSGHNTDFYRYFWEMPFLEMLMYVHSKATPKDTDQVNLLTRIIQSPELNMSTASKSRKLMEQRIALSFFRQLTKRYLR